jgi:polyhydroxybutyrate depolymerase
MSMPGYVSAAPLEPETVTLSQPGPDGGKVDRNYHILMPPNLRRGERPPAVILLHDAGDDALAAVYRHGWIATAAQARFAIIAPEAGLQQQGRAEGGFFNSRVWNAGSKAAASWQDVAFLEAVAKDAAKRKMLDAKRLSLIGFGEGGAMAQRVLREGSGRYAAFASIAGALYGAPEAAKNAPLYLLFGAVDPTNPLKGGHIYTPWSGRALAPAAVKAIHGWRVGLGCPEQPGEASLNSGVHRNEWRDCAGKGALQAVWIEGLGRQWPGTGTGPLPERVTGPPNDAIFAPWDIWRFFEARRLANQN